jgi:hypothetical protein
MTETKRLTMHVSRFRPGDVVELIQSGRTEKYKVVAVKDGGAEVEGPLAPKDPALFGFDPSVRVLRVNASPHNRKARRAAHARAKSA